MIDGVRRLVADMEEARDNWAEYILAGNCVNHAEYVASAASYRAVSDWLVQWKDIEDKIRTGDFDGEQDSEAEI